MTNSGTVYPIHASDSGPLRPTSTGGLVCGKCHEVISAPDFGVLRQARSAMTASGESPIVVGVRPLPPLLQFADLSVDERSALAQCGRGRINHVIPKKAEMLQRLGLMTVERRVIKGKDIYDRKLTEDGYRLALVCAQAEEKVPPVVRPLLDIGPPNAIQRRPNPYQRRGA